MATNEINQIVVNEYVGKFINVIDLSVKKSNAQIYAYGISDILYKFFSPIISVVVLEKEFKVNLNTLSNEDAFIIHEHRRKVIAEVIKEINMQYEELLTMKEIDDYILQIFPDYKKFYKKYINNK